MKNITPKDAVMIALGRAQMAQVNIEINTCAQFKALADIKKSKLYKGLTAIGPDGKPVTVTSFEEFCTHMVKMSREHVDRNIRLLDQLGDEGFQAAQQKNLGYREMLKIARLPDDVKDEAILTLVAEDSDKETIIEALEELAVRNTKLRHEKEEAIAQAERAEKSIVNLEAKLSTSETQKQDLKKMLTKERTGSPYPDFVLTTRHESDALTQKGMLCIDDLTRLANDLQELAGSSGRKSADFHKHLEMAAVTMAVHLRALSVKAQNALAAIDELLPEGMPEISGELLYTDEEVEEALFDRGLLVRDHEQEKQIRENQREAQKPKGRGRPKKVKES